ncbi:MAG TPA: hypothetical protein VF789_33895 [Thermoanaerobaculia bacterium]
MKTVRIPTLVKFGFALLVLVASFVTLPAPAEADCSQTAPTIWYYYDSAKTQFCGQCIYWCDGTVDCSGNLNECRYWKNGKPVYCPC